MFTGIIEKVCPVRSLRRLQAGAELQVDLSGLEAAVGDSIAANGVCLTACGLSGSIVAFEVSAETLERSNLGSLAGGSEVNIERALRPTDRLGGHIVQGHVDAVATVKSLERSAGFAEARLSADPEILSQMVAKGSVALDGVSLTVAAIEPDCFKVVLVPHTLRTTSLGRWKTGDVVNVETDIITRTVKRLLENILPRRQALTAERLRQLGF
jgi:riboflavin synthase